MIIAIQRDSVYPNSKVAMTFDTDTLGSIQATNFITSIKEQINTINFGYFTWDPTDVISVSAADGKGFFNISSDFSTLLPLSSLSNTASALTAHAGGGQANGTPLISGFNTFTVVATAADSATLPVDSEGQTVQVTNTSANSMNVYPASGGTINALSANTALAVAAGSTTTFYGTGTNAWHSK